MSGRIILSLLAETDLTVLFESIAGDAGTDRAEVVLHRLEHTLQNLASWPLIGRIRRDIDHNARVFAMWPWLVIYEPCQDGILVLRVLDTRLDVPSPPPEEGVRQAR